jgi:hypothetical protein
MLLLPVLKMQKYAHTMPKEKTVGELEDEIKHRDRRNEELRQEIDELRELVRKLRENAEGYQENIEQWCESFDMVMTESGGWTWQRFWDEHNKLVDDWNKLVRDWNRFLPVINASHQNVGRPLLASEAQCADVLRRRKAGESLRGIAEETNLGVGTVRTIIGKHFGVDRTTKKHRHRVERIEIDRAQQAKWKRQRRTGDDLPKRVTRYVKETAALIKEAKFGR